MLGSYYEADYYQNPVPYTNSDIGAPVPGWGTSTEIAGPPYVGVGAVSRQLVRKTYAPRVMMAQPTTTPMDEPGGGVADQPGGAVVNGDDEPMPWWIWPAAAVVIMGGVGYLGVKQGWL